MATITVELTPEEDWEDYMDAARICAEVDAGRMKIYSREEINRELDARVDG